jgi:hypothetical protein
MLGRQSTSRNFALRQNLAQRPVGPEGPLATQNGGSPSGQGLRHQTPKHLSRGMCTDLFKSLSYLFFRLTGPAK